MAALDAKLERPRPKYSCAGEISEFDATKEN
jgi:hypothetical protein